ncbi:IS4 family transposase, partial [Streptomyces sp. NPDC127051]|uniref:IS4 family transposase n=1 Tax=Streptomyces sp. NPDC127051 TaxID=3347119 RepID=UPI0036532AF3
RTLFDLLRGPASAIRTAGARWAGLLVVAVDGTHLDVADDQAVRAKLGKTSNQYAAASGYPQVLLVTLVACGTRAVIDAVFGPGKPGESVLGRRLARSLHPGMLVLLDRGFATTDFLNATAFSGAHFLARLSSRWKPPVLARYADGSFLLRIAGTEVRIVACEITIATSQGRRTGVYQLATTLLDHHRYPAFELVRLYHERWEVESAYFEIKKTMPGRRVLRSRSWTGIAQELYALLSTYQLIRIAISDAAHTAGTDPDRCSFTTAVNTARDQVAQAANVIADTVIDLVGAIGRTVLDQPMPAQRLRLSPRAVKRPMSRYAYKSLRVDRHTYKATISIDILLTAPISP